MNDERFLKDWLRDTSDPHSNPQATADKVLASVPDTRQRSRWWPLRPSRPSRPHDQIPDPTGRTRLMLSPISALGAGALAVVLGAAMLIAQPLDRSTSAPAADGPTTPVVVEVTGTSAAGPCDRVADYEATDFGYRLIGRSCHPEWEFNDERLNGRGTNWHNVHGYSGDDGVVVESYSFMIENDDGAWRLRPQILLGTQGVAEPTWPAVWILDGEGAYDGLTAVLTVDDYIPHGYIIDGELPPAPEIASTKS